MSMKENAQTIAENVPKVYGAGELAGIKNESLWRAIQRPNATAEVRNNCTYMFHRFDTKCFYPQYNITPTNASYFARDMTGEPIDLVERLKECGVSMDFSNCTIASTAFYNSKFNHIPELDLRKTGNMISNLFGRNVVTIDKLIINSTHNLKDTFNYCYELQNIIIEGTIGAVDDVSLTHCSSLTLESLKSILTALEDVFGTDRELQYSVILTDRLHELLVEEGATAPNGTTWIEYVDAKGWLI